MNLISFVDELVKLGAGHQLVKRAYDGLEGTGDVHMIDVPQGLMDSEGPPAAIRVAPDEAATRLPGTSHLPSHVPEGTLGGVTTAKDPIDREKYNRAYKDSR